VLLLAQPWQLDRVGGGSAWLGLAGAAGAGAGWAVYIVLMAHVGRLVPGLQGLAVALPVAAVILAPFGAPPVLAAAGAGDWWVLGRCALAAALVPLGAYALEVAALRQMPEPVFGVWMSLEPAFGALAGLALLAQPVAAAQLPGFALVVLAGVATQRAADRRARGELTPSPILQGANR
jgi:inner membrane transporter RhtA